MRSVALCLACLVIGVSAANSDPNIVGRTVELPCVSLTYQQLSSIIQSVRAVTTKANAAYAPEYRKPYETLIVSDGTDKLDVGTDFSQRAFDDAPEIAYSVYYYYTFSDAPVSRIEISLAHGVNSIRVEGASKTEVETVSAVAVSQLGSHSRNLAGPNFRRLAWLTLFVILWLGALLANSSGYLKAWQQVLLSLIVGLTVIVIQFLPWDHWMSGTTVYASDASWFARNSAFLTFLGTLLTVITFTWSVARWISNKVRNARTS